MNLPTFLYCIQAKAGGIAKIGMGRDPRQRMSSARTHCPFELDWRKVVLMPSVELAKAWERYVIGNCTRANLNGGGEWVLANDRLDGALAAITDGDDKTQQFIDGQKFCAIVAPDCDHNAEVNKARLVTLIGPHLTSKAKYDGTEAFDIGLVQARLIEGYGVEDIQAMDGIPADFSRSLIAEWRKDGSLRSRLNLPESTRTIFDPDGRDNAA